MTTIDELAQTISQQYDIEIDPARESVQAFVDQIADDAELWNADVNTLTDAGVNVVASAMAASGEVTGPMATQILDDLMAATEAIDIATAQRDAFIRLAMRAGIPRGEIASAAHVTVARLYQIRDGRR